VNLEQQYKNLIGSNLFEELNERIEDLTRKKILMVYSDNSKKNLGILLEDFSEFVNEFKINFNFCKFVCNFSIKEDYFKSFNDSIEHNLDLVACLDEYDVIIVHDLTCLGLIKYKKNNKWIADIHGEIENFFEEMLDMYDARIVSSEMYKLNDKYNVIIPGINPFSDKNKEINSQAIIAKYNLPMNKPIVLEIAHSNNFIDFVKICENIYGLGVDCTFVFACLEQINFEVNGIIENNLYVLSERNDLLINALQREAICVIDSSDNLDLLLNIKESLWKRTSIICKGRADLELYYKSAVYLVDMIHPLKIAEHVVYLANNKHKIKEIGSQGRDIVLKNNLLIHYAIDYFDLINSLFY